MGDMGQQIRDYLAALDEVEPGMSKSYFKALYEDHPGDLDATVRNIRYGLDHFPPGLVIDMGAGHGMQSYVFARAGRDVLGIDVQEYRVNRAAATHRHLGLETPFEVGDATASLKGKKAGAIWMHRSIHHLPDLPTYFKACHEALAPNGALVFVTSNSFSRDLLRFLPFVRPGRHDPRKIKRQLIDAGFFISDVTYHGFMSGVPRDKRPANAARIDAILEKVPGVRRLSGSFSVTAVARVAH